MNARFFGPILAAAVWIVGLALLAGPQVARAQPTAASDDDRFMLTLGAFVVRRTDVRARVDRVVGPVGIGTTVDWQSDLGGETRMTVPRVDGMFRFNPKHRVDFSWYDIERRGRRVLQREIEFGETTYQVGTEISSRFDTETTKLAYTYSFYRVPEIEVALSFGLHITRFDIGLEASDIGVVETVSTTAPLPVLGFRLDYALSPKWWVRSRYELFFLDSADDYQGSFVDFLLAVEHKTFRHLGFGIGFNRVATDIRASRDEFRGEIGSILNGFVFYAAMRY